MNRNYILNIIIIISLIGLVISIPSFILTIKDVKVVTNTVRNTGLNNCVQTEMDTWGKTRYYQCVDDNYNMVRLLLLCEDAIGKQKCYPILVNNVKD